MDSFHFGGKSNALDGPGKRIIRTVFDDQVECVEEFDSTTGELLVKRWKAAPVFGRQQPWLFEFGEPEVKASGNDLLALSSRNPTFVARDSPNCWEWRVRNIPYPKEVYQLSIDEEKQEIVLRTTNKKFFKRFYIPSLRRAGQPLDPRLLELADYSNNTLTIRYLKPAEIRQAELSDLKSKMRLSSETEKGQGCDTQ